MWVYTTFGTVEEKAQALSRGCSLGECQAYGGESVPRVVELDHLCCGDGGREPCDKARAGGRAFRTGLRCDADSA